MILSSILATADTTNQSNNFYMYIIIGVVAVLAIIMFIPSFLKNRKSRKDAINIKDTLRPGDLIKTVGGVVGTIVDIHETNGEKQFVIETGIGENKSTLTFDMQALYQVITRGEEGNAAVAQLEAERLAAIEAAREAKLAKKNKNKNNNAKATDKVEPFDESAKNDKN